MLATRNLPMNYPTANKVVSTPTPQQHTNSNIKPITPPPPKPTPYQQPDSPNNDSASESHAEPSSLIPHYDSETELTSELDTEPSLLIPHSESEHESTDPTTTTTTPTPIQPTLYDLFTDAPIPSRNLNLLDVNEYCGATMQIPKPPNTTRLTSQNHHHITVSPIENQVIQICRDQRNQASDVHAI
jgi:hypothetical protein